MGLRSFFRRSWNKLIFALDEGWNQGIHEYVQKQRQQRGGCPLNQRHADLDEFVLDRYQRSIRTPQQTTSQVVPQIPESERLVSNIDLDTLSCETYELTVDAEIDYIDKYGNFTRRKITTETLYLYDDGVIVIRAFCHLRKDYRTFVSKRIQYWVDSRTSLPILRQDLAQYLVMCSEDDYSHIAHQMLIEATDEILIYTITLGRFMPNACKVRTSMEKTNHYKLKREYVQKFVKYLLSRNYDYFVHGSRTFDNDQMIELGAPSPRIAGRSTSKVLSSLSTSEIEELTENLFTRVQDFEGSDLNIKIRKSLYRHTSIEIRRQFVSFVGSVFDASPAQDSVVRILNDELLDPSFVVRVESQPYHSREEEVEILRKQSVESRKATLRGPAANKKRSVSFRRAEEKDFVLNLAIRECESRILQRLCAGEMIFLRKAFEQEIQQSIMSVVTKEEIAERGDMFLVRLGAGIRLGYLRSGLKKSQRGWYDTPDGVVIDLNNIQVD